MLISSSFLTSKNIPKDLTLLNETNTDYIHVDVMDGKFVKNLYQIMQNLMQNILRLI